MRSGQLRYRPFPSVPEKRGERQLGSDLGVGWIALISLTDRPPTTRGPAPAPSKPVSNNGASTRRECMPNQVTDKSAVAEQSRVGEVEMALPSSASPSDMLLRRIAILLFILVAGLLTVFGYYAS